ncbi:hypothetical protein CONCODRAFT_4958 [Conidiobolus coronatus NRRL 28638]|uniref:G-protein coupled receptors family 1 profile domain-containing protein n=1 Tax=Conidiobolus coronatus (strain ATCC 28846 / CBS 209.66 / NRRL 28638) TaxID=796925 RepID=A0A137PB33_CONC2|nr:hypothetical protein CONCODRAFT_4958 [Conidiobolus coronatus NRRL 28638]|eukprot:KXN72213.1 hypothetical protein CONCODRAFT_4958 [Conidiobolus coronatus NRRL 28638]
MQISTSQKEQLANTALKYKTPICTQVLFISLSGILICIPTIFIIFTKLKSTQKTADIILLKIIIMVDFYINLSLFINYFLWYFPSNWLVSSIVWCRAQCLVLTVPLLIGGYLICLLSVERYLLIVFNKTLGKKVYQTIAGLCIIYPLCVTSYYISKDSIVLAPIALYCTATANNTGLKFNYGLYSSGILGLVTSVLTTWCYTGISIFRIQQLTRNFHNLNLTKSQAIREATSTILKSGTILALYLLTHVGKTYIFWLEILAGRKRTLEADGIIFNLLCYSSLIDVLLFLNFNSEIRGELARFVGRFKGIRNWRCWD